MEHTERYSLKVLAYTKGIPKGIDVHGPEKFPRHSLLLIYTSFDGSSRTTVILLRQSTPKSKSIGEASLQLRGEEKMRYIALVTLAAALMLPAPAARAITMAFGGILSGANEVPATGSPGTGSVAVVLDPTAETIQIIASFFGLTTPDTAAHIHCCQTLPGMPGTVGVATTVPAFAGFPLNVTQGTYLSPVFSLEDPSFFNPAFVTLQGGMEQAETALIAGIENGLTYFNIHTPTNPGGEIRTQLLPLGVPVPGPIVGAGLPGLIAACGVLLALARRRRRTA